MLVVVIGAGLLYALPNLYGEDPAVQISGGRGIEATIGTLDQVQEVLKTNNIEIKSSSFADKSILVRFNATEVQLHAREVLETALGDKYVVALNLAPVTPRWLQAIGAEPMKLGLDLRGGVHFLLEVDIDTALDKLQEQMKETLTQSLQEKVIPYTDVSKITGDGGIEIRFRDSESRSKAMDYLGPLNRDLVFRSEANNTLRVMMTDERLRTIRESSVQQNINILRKRVNQLGVAEAVVQRQGAERIVVQLPGIQDTARAKELLGATATLEFRQVDSSVDSVSASRGFIPGSSEVKYDGDGKPVVLYKRVVLTGDHIIDSAAGKTDIGLNQVSVELDSAGGKIMSDFTSKNIGKLMATLFVEYKDSGRKDTNGKAILEKHEEVISAATIQGHFANRFQITGVGSQDDAQNLSMLLRAGALIAPVQIVEERTIGPSLGQQNITQGLEACLWGLLLCIGFMLVVYRTFGLMASAALLANVVLIVGAMSLLPGATLTMPGIAGIVLTVGVAIDANVLINERIKEELSNGRGVQQAIHEGYKGAFTSILDANLTTLLTAAILYGFGTGSIKGFAITLAIGVLTSMFTAIIGTRAIVNLVYGGKRINKLSI